MLESLEDAKESLESSEIQKAQQAIEKGIVEVKERQKLILLADQSQIRLEHCQGSTNSTNSLKTPTMRRRFIKLKQGQPETSVETKVQWNPVNTTTNRPK